MMLRTKKEVTSLTLRVALVVAGGFCLFIAVAGGANAAVGLESTSPNMTAGSQHGEKPYNIGKDVTVPKVLYAPEAEFPKSAPTKGPIGGNCLIALIVDVTGTPRDVHVVHSFSKEFDRKAIEAVQKYRFSPGEHLGKPVPVTMNVEVNFQRF